jgi:hypothetical protein
METPESAASPSASRGRRRIPRNLWAVSVTSFLTDLSSEMVVNLVPLFLANVLGARMVTIGLIEGVAASTASLIKVFSGALSDRLRARKWLAVGGYALSALAKPGFYFASSWGAVAAVRWAERAGKGVREAPRDALVAGSVDAADRGLAFGMHRAADTGGAVVGLLIAVAVLGLVQRGGVELTQDAFQLIVLVTSSRPSWPCSRWRSAPSRSAARRRATRPASGFAASVAASASSWPSSRSSTWGTSPTRF